MTSVVASADRYSVWVVGKDVVIMSEEIRTIESYEAEIKELKNINIEMQNELNCMDSLIKSQEREILRLQGMVEAFEICVKARKK